MNVVNNNNKKIHLNQVLTYKFYIYLPSYLAFQSALYGQLYNPFQLELQRIDHKHFQGIPHEQNLPKIYN